MLTKELAKKELNYAMNILDIVWVLKFPHFSLLGAQDVKQLEKCPKSSKVLKKFIPETKGRVDKYLVGWSKTRMDWKKEKLFTLLRSLCELFVGEFENKLTSMQKNQNVDSEIGRTRCDPLCLADYWQLLGLHPFPYLFRNQVSCLWWAVATAGEVSGLVVSWLGLFMLINHFINISYKYIFRYIISTNPIKTAHLYPQSKSQMHQKKWVKIRAVNMQIAELRLRMLKSQRVLFDVSRTCGALWGEDGHWTIF